MQEVIESIHMLPTLPSTVVQVYETATDPDASALDLARHFAPDQSLSAALLRLVNSAYYGFQREVTNVTDAIVILGFTQVRDLALTATAFKAFPETRTTFDRTQLWRHSLAVGITADRLSKRIGLPPSAGCFSAGLLHDVGKVVFDLVYPQEYMIGIRIAHEREELIGPVEHEFFGLNHGEAGALLAQHWNLPDALREGARHHHQSISAADNTIMVALIALADHITYLSGLGESSNGRQPELPREAIAHLGIDEGELGQLTHDTAASREQIDVLLGILGD